MTIDHVCSSCFGDENIREWVRQYGGPRGCDACGGYDSPTAPLDELCAHLSICLSNYWGLAVEQLPYESAEGGYQGQTWYTAEVLYEEGLDLPRDHDGSLFDAICAQLPDELWCDYDWLRLDPDVALGFSWDSFCETVKHRRRFFFHEKGGDDTDLPPAGGLLSAIASMCEDLGLIKGMDAGANIWRARPDLKAVATTGPADFGPPPREKAVQSNRMNPPGIPMFYGAFRATTAVREVRANAAVVGHFRLARAVRVLDLANLPKVPGTFSDASRRERLGLRFLHSFADAIMQPVARDDRVHVDYIPSQVVTEYLREHTFSGGPVDGVLYPSTVDVRGRNIVLFIDGVQQYDNKKGAKPMLEFVSAKRVAARPLK